MDHVWRLGKQGCHALAKDFEHFARNKCSNPADVRKCSTKYAATAVERWNAFAILKPARAKADAQKLLKLYEHKINYFVVVDDHGNFD